MIKYYIYGTGGVGREIAELLMMDNKNVTFIDDNAEKNVCLNAPVVRFNSLIEDSKLNDCKVIISIGEPFTREILYAKCEEQKLDFFTFNKASFLSGFSKIGNGCAIHFGSYISNNCTIQDNVLINKNAIIGHDCTIGENSVISPGVLIGGNTTIGKNVFVGIGAVVKNGVSIMDNAIVGMGAVVTKSVNANEIVVGNPAKFIKYNESKKVFK